MKVQQLAVGGFWEQQLQDPSSPSSFSSSSSSSSTSTTSSLTVRFKRLRPLAPNLTATVTATAVATTQTVTSLDRKDFQFPKTKCTAANPDSSHVVETPSGGTRWNPAPEQIRVLEALYLGGMRTPNAHQIECITAELSKYGRIEGKNVFYWFQNHKARERQKQKRSALLALSSSNSNNYSSPCSPIMTLMTTSSRVDTLLKSALVYEIMFKVISFDRCHNLVDVGDGGAGRRKRRSGGVLRWELQAYVPELGRHRTGYHGRGWE